MSDDEIALPKTRDVGPPEVLRAVADACDRGVPVAMATVLVRRGSAPSTPGQKLAVFGAEDGVTAIGTVGGGAVERATLLALVAMLPSESPARIETFKLGASLGMCCGGSVDMLLEPMARACSVLIVGGGHVGSATAPLLATCGFIVTLVDARSEHGAPHAGDHPRLSRVVGEFDDVGRGMPRDGVVVTMTHDHQLDQRVVEWALGEGFAFVGGVGSRAKYARTCARLEAKGVAPDLIARVRMPIGVDIGARTPSEIAVAIAAELIDWRRRDRSA